MFICVVRVVGGSTRKRQSRVERGNIFPTFTMRQAAGGRAGNQAAGESCVEDQPRMCVT